MKTKSTQEIKYPRLLDWNDIVRKWRENVFFTLLKLQARFLSKELEEKGK